MSDQGLRYLFLHKAGFHRQRHKYILNDKCFEGKALKLQKKHQDHEEVGDLCVTCKFLQVSIYVRVATYMYGIHGGSVSASASL